MIESIRNSGVKYKEEIAEILARSGARHLAMLQFESSASSTDQKK
jgi:hypothetical protein